jgi:hypothetical protein
MINRSSLELEIPYFCQDESRPQTYNRTGIEIEIEREGQEIFEYMFIGGMFIGIIIGFVQMIF